MISNINFALQSTFIMTEKHKEYLDNLSEIRSLMDRSSRFISLSGLAGVFAGIWALCGAAYAYNLLLQIEYPYNVPYHQIERTLLLLVADGIITLLLAVSSGIYFTTRKAKQEGESIWDKKILTVIWNLAVPLAAGGVFCLILLYHGLYLFVPPATLIFYGLALFNTGSYTHRDIKQLGIVEIILGLTNCIFLGKGLYFWAFGFGIMHIIYGIIMYYKYERKTK